MGINVKHIQSLKEKIKIPEGWAVTVEYLTTKRAVVWWAEKYPARAHRMDGVDRYIDDQENQITRIQKWIDDVALAYAPKSEADQ